MLIHRFKNSIRTHIFAADGEVFAERFNFFNRMHWRFPVEVRWAAEVPGYAVTTGSEQIVFARKERVWLYSRGVAARVDSLAQAYFLPRLALSANHVVIDCGANIGEFARSVRQRGAQVIAVEPELREARCIAANAPGTRAVVNKALWKQEGHIEFFSKNESGDSSIFEMKDYQSVTRVPTTTLDLLFAEHGIERLRLLKLEAEGAEPEILDGAGNRLGSIDYIAADLGPERGMRQETTLAPVSNRLYAAGFELVDVHPGRMICLFRNTRTTRRAGTEG